MANVKIWATARVHRLIIVQEIVFSLDQEEGRWSFISLIAYWCCLKKASLMVFGLSDPTDPAQAMRGWC